MNHSAVGQQARPGGKLLRRAGFRAAAAVAAGSLLLASAGVAYADTIYNKLDATIDPTAEVMPLNVGGPNGTTTLALEVSGGDGKPGCNVTGQTSLTLNVSSSNTGVAAVGTARVIFNSCDSKPQVLITPVGVGTSTISVSEAFNDTRGTFNLATATFTVNVSAPAPSNRAPILDITGVTGGASYAKGSVPAAVCSVADHEDVTSSFAATLGAITGRDAATGVGSQEASCEYTDAGGLYVKSSVTYNIVDPTAPVISYVLNPVDPDGDNGWYRNAVTLTWTVSEPDSPSTLIKFGCVDQVIEADQVATSYSCSATSSGGSAAEQTVSIKKDGTAPEVSHTGQTGTLGKNGWYVSNVVAEFTARDTTSGPVSATQYVTSGGEGAAVEVASPAFADNAGNGTPSGAANASFDIDWTAPTVSYTSAAGTAGTNGWYRSDVVATFSGSDATSGLASPATLSATSIGEGTAIVVQSPVFEDIAGNTSAVGATPSDTFMIDKTAPAATFDSIVADSYFGSTPAVPTCTASDELSGPDSCVVSGYKTTVGIHTLTATATDKAGNTARATQTYTVKAWTLKGFYQPIDMGGVLNTVKGGSTVPAKFEVFAGDTEITDPSLLSFSATAIQCTSQLTDDVEVVATGNTSLRYDVTAGQFIYNWKTPIGPGKCYQLIMTAKDGSTISANFKLK